MNKKGDHVPDHLWLPEPLYQRIKQDVLSGRLIPGERIRVAPLAKHHRTGFTRAQLALYSLLGECILEHSDRRGFYIPLQTEVALCDYYDWVLMQLAMAYSTGLPLKGQPLLRRKHPRWAASTAHSQSDGGIVGKTRQLLEDIVGSTDNIYMLRGMQLTNDRLTFIRRTELYMAPLAPGHDPAEEIASLDRYWQLGKLGPLKSAWAKYHERRRQAAPRIVATLRELARSGSRSLRRRVESKSLHAAERGPVGDPPFRSSRNG